MHRPEKTNPNKGPADPMKSWNEWITKRHTEFTTAAVAELELMGIKKEERLAKAHAAMAHAMMASASELFYDISTGVIYGENCPDFDEKTIDYCLGQSRQRLHEVIDSVFDEYDRQRKERDDEE